MEAPRRDIWQQGGNAALTFMSFVRDSERERLIELDDRTVYRRRDNRLEKVAVFETVEDAAQAIRDHNASIDYSVAREFELRLERIIQDLPNLGDPTL